MRWLLAVVLSSCAVAAAQDDASAALDRCLARMEDFARKNSKTQADTAAATGTGPRAATADDAETATGAGADNAAGADTKTAARADTKAARAVDVLEVCPELEEALQNSAAASWLPEDMWGAPRAREGLADLRDQLAWESTLRESRTIDTSGVSAALESLGAETQASASTWWERLRDWLRTRLRRDPQDPPGWLFEWLENLSGYQAALRITAYALCALIVLSAAWIVYREIRAGGGFRSGSSRLAAPGGVVQGGAGRSLRLDDLDRADPAERPSMLVAMIVAALARQSDRTEDTTSTHRELARHVQLGSQPQRTAFEILLACAERLRYAAAQPARADIDQAVGKGVALLRSLLPGEARP